MLALPFVFVIFIVNFEAGLIVYWITTNVWTIGQQLVVRKLYPRPDLEDGAAVPAGAVALAGKSDGKKSASKSDASGNGAAKAPPPSPRKKKKRSGRRR